MSDYTALKNLQRELSHERERNRELEKTLEDTERIVYSLMHSAPDVVYRLDSEGNIVFLSESISDYGYSPNELLGKRFIELVHPDDRDKALYRVNERRTGKRSTKQLRLRFITKNKDTVPFEVKSKHIDTDQVFLVSAEGLYSNVNPDSQNYIGTVGIARDITERLVAEEALRDSESKYRKLFEESNDAVLIFDPDGTIRDVNRKAYNILGYAREYLLLKPVGDLHPDSERRQAIQEYKKALKRVSVRFESKMIRSDNSIIDVEISAGYINEDNAVIQAIVRDITDRKRTEQQLRNSLEEKEVLMREIHHRVKNNIQVISSLLSLQADKITNDFYVDMFVETINRIQSMGLIHTMLYQSENYSQIDFGEYVRRITETLGKLYKTENGLIAMSIDIERLLLSIDIAIPCGLVINELVSNALKHAFPGNPGGEISITMKRNRDKKIELKVKDNGIGISDDMDWQNTDSLGMMIVRLLVKRQLGGSVECMCDNGTEFVVIFPG